MTAHSTITPSQNNLRGYLQTHGSVVPPEMRRSLNLTTGSSYWNALRELSKAKAEGFVDTIPALADAAAQSLAPVDHKALINRLTLLGMTMLHGKSPEEVTAWLHETARLLSDLPEHILFNAIDECVKEPGRVFAPTVGEILAKASNPLHHAETEAARLREMANLMADGVTIPEYEPPAPMAWNTQPEEPKVYCTAEEARQILIEEGLVGTPTGDALEKMMVAGRVEDKRPKTRAEYIAQGKVPPRLTPDEAIRV